MIKPDITKLYRTQLSEKHFKNTYPEYTEYLNSHYPDLSWQDKLYCDQHNLQEPPKCPICGNIIPLISLYKGYKKYCTPQCAYKDPARTQKIQSTILERYGVEHALRANVIKEKFKSTCVGRFGTDNPTKNKIIAKKAQKTTIERYGALGSASTELCKRAVSARRKNRLKKSTIAGQLGYTEDGQWIMQCNKSCPGCDRTYNIWAGTYFDRMRLGYELCTKINPVDPKKIKNTRIESFVHQILDENNIQYESNVRTLISPKEVDVYIPSKNIAIECNGCYWHSMKPRDYHFDKYNGCAQQGIHLITIWEDWVVRKPEQTKSLILSKLGIYNRKIGARECDIVEPKTKEIQSFFETNHIQGRCNSKVKLGLMYSGELVCAMAFNKRSSWTKDDCWELVRFCNKINTQVIGGASRLLNYFISHYNAHKIVSFSSNDISDGSLYKILGFEMMSKGISYWYINQSTFQRFHRTSFCKSRLTTMGYNTSNKTESEIMNELPYWKIYDSGVTGWVLNKKGLN